MIHICVAEDMRTFWPQLCNILFYGHIAYLWLLQTAAFCSSLHAARQMLTVQMLALQMLTLQMLTLQMLTLQMLTMQDTLLMQGKKCAPCCM